jgi:hypothetical protein
VETTCFQLHPLSPIGSSSDCDAARPSLHPDNGNRVEVTMEITVELAAGQARVALVNPDDFARFSLKVISSGPVDRQVLADALEGVAWLDPDTTHAFVEPEALRQLAGERTRNSEWCTGLERMIAYADSKGWTSQSGAIRVHIEPSVAEG